MSRSIRGAIQTYLENPLAKKLISGQIPEGTTITITASDLAKNPDMDHPFTPDTALIFSALEADKLSQ